MNDLPALFEYFALPWLLFALPGIATVILLLLFSYMGGDKE